VILRKSHNKKKLLELKDQELHQTQVEKVIKAVRKLKKPLNRQFKKKKNKYQVHQILIAVSLPINRQ